MSAPSSPSQLFAATLSLQPWLPGNTPLRRGSRVLLERVIGLHHLNGVINAIGTLREPGACFDRALDVLGVSLEVSGLQRIPSCGPCLLVANHPFGMMEGIALGALVRAVRPDIRILGNSLLMQVPAFRELTIPVDPFGGPEAARRNVAGMRAACRWLDEGGALLVFPAGEVAHLRVAERGVTEGPWAPHLARLARREGVTVVPVHFQGRNRLRFQLAGLVHPLLRTALLPREFWARRGRPLRGAVGEPLPFRAIGALELDDRQLMATLRARCLAIGERPVDTGPEGVPVAAPEPLALLEAEIAALPPDAILDTSGSLVAYVAEAAQIPGMLRHIGREREVAFRAVGEGTGRARDLDRFDQYYLHLFIWDRAARALAGAYRMGRVDRILREQGVRGLYTRTLFALRPRLFHQLGPALELGRSFVTAPYQRGFGALNLLWRGIGRWVAKHPQYRHLLGAVSISNSYGTMAQWLMTRFLADNHQDRALSRLVRPRRRVRLRTAADTPWPANSLESVSRLVQAADPEGRDIPVLLRQYLRLGGRLLGANRDRRFNDAIDELIVVDLLAAPPALAARYLGEDGLAAVRRAQSVAAPDASPPWPRQA